MRIKSVWLIITFVFFLIAADLFYLQAVRGVKFRELSNRNCIKLLPQAGNRGRIFDRNGDIIVGNSVSYDVMLFPQKGNGVNMVLGAIAKILDKNFDDLKGAYESGSIAPFIPIAISKNIDTKKAMALEEARLDLPGIIIQPKPQRQYPFGKLACHALGYLSEIDRWRLTKVEDYGYKTKDVVGFGGVEEKYDYYLRPVEGGLSVEVDHRGRLMRVLGFKLPQNGKDIQLTLDLKIQKIAEDALQDKAGAVVIMNPHSGEIIAIANNPYFNPGAFAEKKENSISKLLNDPDAPLINRAASSAFPPGSIFKLIVAAAALDTGKISLYTSYTCTGSARIGNRQFACWNTHGNQSLLDAIAHSCDNFFYRVGLLIGPQAMHDYAVKFGLSKLTEIDLPYEIGGLVPSPLKRRIYRFKGWFDGDTANFAIGQGELLTSPLQIARMMAVFANQGNLVTPHIIKAVDGQDISAQAAKIVTLPIKKEALKFVREGLRRVVSDQAGTARMLSDLPVSVAGKTGTAQSSPRKPHHGWFAGFFPLKEPKFAFCVFLEYGGSGHAAVALTRQIIEAMIKERIVTP